MDAVLERTKAQTIIACEQPKINGEPKIVRWTRDQYYQMAELGFFRDKRVELIKGEIIEMSPMKSAHATAISLAVQVLGEIFNKNFIVRSQLPMGFGKTDEPEPDIAVVKGTIRNFSGSHPKNADLIIEVSDTTLRYDRTRKASLYAENKISDYWILNLQNRCLEVYRQPKKDKKLGFVYTEIKISTEEDAVSPLAAPDAKIKIADLLP
ncbi:MAG: Uma2 family endonuclease [Pyrinomonadaceae bacterium]|nr:Uma2 family endonuclease [Pyrinomonadaceae bacterium]